jgi:D-glycero-beta-D-manno-heptose-7-phosphate kinase
MTSERIEALLAAIPRARVLVVGDLMLDRYVSGAVDRVSPEAPVPVVRVEEERSAIGGAGNVAANVAALGATCTVVGCAGRDEGGRTLRAELEALGVGTDGIVAAAGRPTTVKTRVMARHQQVVRFDHEVESDVDARVAEAIAATVAELAASCDVLILEDYNKGVLTPGVIAEVLETGAERGIPSIADPKRRNFFAYRGVTVFKPNAKELEDALGDFIHPDDPVWMEATRRRLGCGHLLLTLGERGVALQTGEGTLVRVPTVARSVYDVSGAGDTVTAVVAVVLAAGGSPAEAAVLANHAAAVEVAKAGVATVSPAEIREQLRGHES